MCGIAGILPARPAEPAELERRVRAMAGALVHRGPDDDGFHVTPDVALGMRRLAIIDRAGGAQPMHSRDGSLTLVFNGELYNYRAVRAELARAGCEFQTDSDTEVLLRVLEREGLDGVRRLEGMFAFALWNARERRLTLARDWLGQKSLYLAQTPAGLAFASEMKALLALPGVSAELDLQAISHYMSLRYLPGDTTLFRDVRKLASASAWLCEPGGEPRLTQLWRPSYEPKLALGEREWLDRLDATLAEVVEQHLISEVPIGCFLSGGIDSSLIVAYAARAQPGRAVRTFSIGVHEDAQNELPWARQVAERYRTDHFEAIVEPDLARLAPRMVAALEEPVDPFGAGVYVVAEVARKHVTVALGGDGGDELFAGYDRYLGQQYAALYARLPAALRRGVLRPLLRAVPDSFGYNSAAARLRWLDRVADFDGPERFAESAAFLRFGHERKAQLFSPERWTRLEAQRSERLLDAYFSDGCAVHPLDCMLHADLSTRIADNDLPTTDRLTMAHSLELRSPLLDRRVAELAMRAPAPWKLRRGRLKYLTRKLAERHLPHALVHRPKQGFGFPLARWLAGPLRPLLQQVVDESSFAEAGIFRRAALQELLDAHASGAQDHCYRLWMLFQLELFWRHFVAHTPVAELEAWVNRGLGSG